VTDLEEKKEKILQSILVKITRVEAPFAPKAQLGDYEIHRWKWFEKQRATEAATIEIDRQQGIVKWDIAVYYLHMLFYSVKKVPAALSWSQEFIQTELDPDVGDILTQSALKLNAPTKEEKRTFLGRLSSGTVIHGLTSTGPAEPSESSQKKED